MLYELPALYVCDILMHVVNAFSVLAYFEINLFLCESVFYSYVLQYIALIVFMVESRKRTKQKLYNPNRLLP